MKPPFISAYSIQNYLTAENGIIEAFDILSALKDEDS